MMKRKLNTMISALTLHALTAFPATSQVFYEEYKIVPNGVQLQDFYGSSVSASGSNAIITRCPDDYRHGAAYLYNINSIQQLIQISAPCFNCDHGFACAAQLDGNMAIIGASRFKDHEISNYRIGAAFIYNINTGEQVVRLLPDEPYNFDLSFGESVAISGDYAVVGDTSGRIGSAYVFNITTGLKIAKLAPSDGIWFQSFGESIAIDANVVAVGNSTDNDYGFDSGSVYLYNAATGQETHKITPVDGAAGDRFGTSIAISGTTLIVGSPFDDDNGNNSGSAYLYDTTTGQQIAKLLPEDGAEPEQFGISVDIDGDVAICGASRDNPSGGESGSTYLFDTLTGQQITKLVASDGDQGDMFGNAVAISGSTLVIGANQDEAFGYRSGSAYVFSIPQCVADLTADGIYNFFDVSTFLAAFAENDPIADFNLDGSFDFFDVSAFLVAYEAGCP